MSGQNDPFGVDCTCRFCDQELDSADERILGAHHGCIEADQAEVDAIAAAWPYEQWPNA